MAGHGSSVKAILYAFLANLGISIAKGIGAFYTGSGSMLAESVHSMADCANQLLLFLGLKRSNRAPTLEHPLGYGVLPCAAGGREVSQGLSALPLQYPAENT